MLAKYNGKGSGTRAPTRNPPLPEFAPNARVITRRHTSSDPDSLTRTPTPPNTPLPEFIPNARVIIHRHPSPDPDSLTPISGELPSEVSELLSIPGIGPYTAGAIASIAFNRPAPLVDGNVLRWVSPQPTLTPNPR